MSKYTIEKLKFPSGRTIKRMKQDAKALAKSSGVPLNKALDETAENNGMMCGWSNAIHILRNMHNPSINKPSKVETDMNPYRKLLVLGLNEVLSRKLLSLDWDGKSRVNTGHIETTIANFNSIVCWSDAGFGEIRISVWWKYDHSLHPQANLEGSSREEFSSSSPLAKRQHYPKFVGIVCGAWLERDEGKYLQGKKSERIIERYARRGELTYLKSIPNPAPIGFETEGRFHM
ncbi:MAG: hypothetical protein QM504_18735 [Pseudomonadota bacterium]